VQLDLICAPKWQIGSLGFLFLFGIVVGCLTITKLGDLYGRKPVYLAGLAMNFGLILILMFSVWPWLSLIAVFGLGLSITARYYVGYTYTVEMSPKN
jgi:MFS family permease